MPDRFDKLFHLPTETTAHPNRARTLRIAEGTCVAVGVAATLIERGMLHITDLLHWELGILAIVLMFGPAVSLGVRWRWSLSRRTFWREHRSTLLMHGIWLMGSLTLALFGHEIDGQGGTFSRGEAVIALTEVFLLLRAVLAIGVATRRAAAGGWDPAFVLVGSFLLLIVVGSFLLMLPASQQPSAHALPLASRLRAALFTATSATCVTGLIVVPTGGPDAFWTRTGQTVILCLIQVGGLGIMTYGAFFAVLLGRDLPVRESVALRDLLEFQSLADVRRLLLAIIGFTFCAELLGAVLLSGLWSDLPLSEQIYYSVFHSVSAFCNAGFALHPDSFIGMGGHWQVWAVVPTLVIAGGLGFIVVYNTGLVLRSRFQVLTTDPLFGISRERTRLTLTSKLVLSTTGGLLVAGTVGYLLLESFGLQHQPRPLAERISEAWFQSVSFRSAGFSTIDHAQLQPGTKLFGVLWMFIGASPGSTGGGVKTVSFIIAVVAMLSILRGRDRVEFFGRTIPHVQINRALVILVLGTVTAMTTALLLAVFESRPERFIDQLYEATSAAAISGASTGITGTLTAPSQFTLMAAMFIGRLGPLTLLLALAGRHEDRNYDYPVENVVLG